MALKAYTIPDGEIVFRHDLIEQNTVLVGDEKFVFPSEAEARLFLEAAEFFGPGEYELPDNGDEARRALDDWLEHKKEIETWFWECADEKSDDQRFKEKMVAAMWTLYRTYRRGLRNAPGAKKSPVHRIRVDESEDGEPKPIVFEPLKEHPTLAPPSVS